MTKQAKQIGFIGTGLMGVPMVRNLLAAGFAVSVWNRTVEKSQPLVADGATVAGSVAELLNTVDVVITMVTDDKALDAILFESDNLDSLRSGTTLIDMSSIPPQAALRHAKLCEERGCDYLDAPVSGGTIGAANATLAIMVGGKQAVFSRCDKLFAALGRPILVGPCSTGQLSKLCNQLIVGITIGAVAEALMLAQAGGADPAAVREAISGGFADSTILQVHGQRMLERNFEPGGLSTIQLKDMHNIVEHANQLNIDLPIANLLRELYANHVEQGGGDLDHSSLLLHLERKNGIAS